MEVSEINLEYVSLRVADELRKAADNIRQNHLEAGQKSSGKTANSIRSEVILEPTAIRGIIWGRAPFTDLEQGRAPGPGPSNFYRIILDWMHFKGIKASPIPYKRQPSDKWTPKYSPQDRGDRTLAYFISKKIEEEGTTLYRNGGRSDIYSKDLDAVSQRISESVLRIFGKEIDNINQRSKTT